MPTESEMRVVLGVVQIERDLQRVIIGHVLPFVPLPERRRALELMQGAANAIRPVVRPETLEEADQLIAEVVKVCGRLHALLVPPLEPVANDRGVA